MNEVSQRRLRLVTDAAYSPDLAGDPAERAAESPPEPPVSGVPTTNGALLKLRHRWSTPPMVAVRVGFAVLALALVAVAAIAWSRPSGSPGEEPELAWPDPPSDWTGDADTSAPRTGEGEVSSSDDGGAHPGHEAGQAGAGDASGDDADDDGVSPGLASDGSAAQGGERAVVVVHVAGQVEDPGVVELPEGSRVHEALDAAGGPTSRAALEAINLAATLTDGQQLYVPAVGEEPREPIPAPSGPPGPTEQAPGGPDPGAEPAPVDLNTADEATLQTLPGIGPAMASRIIEHRTANGPFTSVDQLSAVSGIGPATLARLRDLVTV